MFFLKNLDFTSGYPNRSDITWIQTVYDCFMGFRMQYKLKPKLMCYIRIHPYSQIY